MAYTKITNFATKDSTNDVILGTEHDNEFNAIQAESIVVDNALALKSAISTTVLKTSSTGSAVLPNGTTAQRDGSPVAGYIRYNLSTNSFEGYGLAWGSIGGGATGGTNNSAFYENDTLITADYTIGSGAIVNTVTVVAATNLFTATAHGFIADQLVQFATTTTLPAPLQTAYGYYVISSGLTTDAFKVSLTMGGTEIDITDTGTGVHTVGKLKNSSTAGVISIASGATVTIPTNATWSIS